MAQNEPEPGLSDADYFATFGELWCSASDHLVTVDFERQQYHDSLMALHNWLDDELARIKEEDQ